MTDHIRGLRRAARGRGLTPRRVRVEGDLFHGRVPEGAVYVGRAAPGLTASPYANPHRLGKPCAVPYCAGTVHTRAEAVSRYRGDLRERPDLVEGIRRDVTGRDVACWCKPDEVCHGDVVLAVAAGAPP